MNRQVLKHQLMALAIYDANNTTMTVAECSKFLGKSYGTIINWIDKKHIEAVHRKGTYSIPKIQFLERIVEKFLEQSKQEDSEFVFELDIDAQVKKSLKKILSEVV
jgi:transposase